MSDNYPPGAAHDPRAPYNEPIPTETEVRVTTTMVKEYCLKNVQDDDLEECFNDQEYKLHITLERCRKVCQQLLKDGHWFYAHIHIHNLMEECDDWEMEEFNIEEI